MADVNQFLVHSKLGLYCQVGDFYLDPRKAVHRALVSHAHSDHAVPNSGTIWCTRGTRLLMSRRFGNYLRSGFQELSYGKPEELNGVRFTFYPAGHMLGSAQILLEWEGERYLYTGDFKLQSDESCEAFELVACDHLITETTFASPEYAHPDPAKEMGRLNESRQNILVGAYAIGKAQRITRLVSDHCPDKTVWVHPDLAAFHRIYEQEGRSLGNWQLYQRSDFKEGENGVYVLPPSHFSRYSRNKEVVKYFATGWKKSYLRCDGVLSVSDHADWNDLLKLVQDCGAHSVYTMHGNGEKLRDHLADSGKKVFILE